MMSYRFILSILLNATILVVASDGWAQHPMVDQGTSDHASLTDVQQQALMMLPQIALAAHSIHDQLRGAVLEAQAADLLWPYDEPQARTIFQRALERLAQFRLPERTSHSQQQELLNRYRRARSDILKLLGRHDPQAAEKRARTLDEVSPRRSPGSFDGDAEDLVQMALDHVKRDPGRALQLGLESLKRHTFADSLGLLLVELWAEDRQAARQLLRAAIRLLEQPDVDVLKGLFELAWLPFGGRGPVDPLLREEAHHLLEIYFHTLDRAVLTLRRGGHLSPSVARSLRSMADRHYLNAFQQNDPERLSDVRWLLGELSRRLDVRYRKLSQLQPLVKGEYGDFQSRLSEANRETDPVIRDAFLRALAVGATRRRAFDEARRAAARISDVSLRQQTRDDINLGQVFDELSNGQYNRAYEVAQRITELALKARVMVEIVKQLMSDTQDEITATHMLDQAYTVAQRANPTIDKVRALLVIAQVYASMDPAQAFRAFASVVQAVNHIRSREGRREERRRTPVRITFLIAPGAEDIIKSRARIALEDVQFGSGFEHLAGEDYVQAMLLATSVRNPILRARMQLAAVRGVLRKGS